MSSVSAQVRRLLLPMHSDNWALSLASGYLGLRLKDDYAADAQDIGDNFLVCFANNEVPSWAMEFGDTGSRTVVEIEVPPSECDDIDGATLVAAPQRVTRAKVARFETQDDLRNFEASYSPFPDVPTGLIETAIGGFAKVDRQQPEIIAQPNGSRRKDGVALNYFGGWAAGLADFANDRKISKIVVEHLNELGDKPATLARSLLQRCNPNATPTDLAIWTTTIQVISEKAAARGFDRLKVLHEIGERIPSTADAKALRTWLLTCERVVKSVIDPPPLDDDGSIGQRAALSVLLASDVRAARNIGRTLGAGQIVQFLATVAAFAFEGLTRASSEAKGNRAKLDALLDTAERIQSLENRGQPPVGSGLTNVEAAQTSQAGQTSAQPKNPSAAQLILRARAIESGFEIFDNDATGETHIETPAASGTRIFLEDDPSSTPSHSVVRFVVELKALPAKPGKQTQELLELAWSTGCAIGIRTDERGSFACAFSSQPTGTLDRDEFAFHIERLIATHQSIAPKRAAPKAKAKRPANPGPAKPKRTKSKTTEIGPTNDG
jgi:hypothetical protein